MKLGGGNSKMFYFHPYLGKIPILTHIFQMGWNHQLGNIEEVVCSFSFLEGTGLIGARNEGCFLILHAELKYVKQCFKIIQNRMFAVCFFQMGGSQFVVPFLVDFAIAYLFHQSCLTGKNTTTAWNICIRELLCVHTISLCYVYMHLKLLKTCVYTYLIIYIFVYVK